MGDQVKILGLPNWSAVSTATMIGGASTELPASNVLDAEPTKVSRGEIMDPRYTQWFIPFITPGGPSTATTNDVGGVAIVNHSVRSGQFRVVADTTSGGLSVAGSNIAPASIQSSSGFTGAVGDIDEDPVSPDGSYGTLAGTNGANHVRIRFTNPASALKVGADRQLFVALVTPTLDEQPQYLNAELYFNGSLREDLGSVVIGGATGVSQYVWWSWDAASLPSPSSINIEVRLTIASPLFGAGAVRIQAVAFRAVLGTESPDFDSGWIDIPEYDLDTSYSSDPAPTRAVHYFPESPWEGVSELMVMIRASSCRTVNECYGGLLPFDYIDVGCIVIGKSFTPQYGLKQNSIRTNVSVQQHSGSAMAGQAYSADAFRYRMADFTLILTRSERDTLVNSLDWRKGLSSPFYIALEPSLDLSYQQFTAFYCVVDKAGQSEQIPMEFSTSQRYYKSYTVKERL